MKCKRFHWDDCTPYLKEDEDWTTTGSTIAPDNGVRAYRCEQAPEIKFCNELDLMPPCISETIEWDYNKCNLIPDSSAKGDNGSSFQVCYVPLRCRSSVELR